MLVAASLVALRMHPGWDATAGDSSAYLSGLLYAGGGCASVAIFRLYKGRCTGDPWYQRIGRRLRTKGRSGIDPRSCDHERI